MKANRRVRSEDNAEAGIGTLIVFIAMVLVAAVAAAVIIGTSGQLQQRALITGQDATKEVSSNFKLIALYGQRANANADISAIKVDVALAAGAVPVDLTRVVLRYSDGVNVVHYEYSATDVSLTTNPVFNVNYVRGQDSNAVMESGDLVELLFDLNGVTIMEGTDIELLLVPEVGSPVLLDFRTPYLYDTFPYVRIL